MSAGASFIEMRPIGVFHGMIAPTTPTGSLTKSPKPPRDGRTGRSHSKMSAACASATVRKTCSECESITSIVESDEGATHSPPMKKRSVCLTDAVASSEMVMRAFQLRCP